MLLVGRHDEGVDVWEEEEDEGGQGDWREEGLQPHRALVSDNTVQQQPVLVTALRLSAF